MSVQVYRGWEFPSVKVEPPRERYLKLIACPETTGYKTATVLFSHLPAGSGTGKHIHPDSDEIMYFVGRGECLMDGKAIGLETDSVIIAPRGVEHECRNTSQTETLKIFCVYVPPLKLNELLTGLAQETKKYLAGQK